MSNKRYGLKGITCPNMNYCEDNLNGGVEASYDTSAPCIDIKSDEMRRCMNCFLQIYDRDTEVVEWITKTYF